MVVLTTIAVLGCQGLLAGSASAETEGQAIVAAAQNIANQSYQYSGSGPIDSGSSFSSAKYIYCFDGGTTGGATAGGYDNLGTDGTYSNCNAIGRIGFDCRGLTLYAVFQGSGGAITLPTNTAGAQYSGAPGYGGSYISLSALQPGDLVFFGSSSSAIDHVGIVVSGTGTSAAIISAVSEKWGIETHTIAWFQAEFSWVGAVAVPGVGNSNSTVTVSTSSLPQANFAAPYSASLSASGGSGSYSWTMSGGALPTGLSLSSSGVISGVVNTIGTSVFSVTATDSQGHQASATLAITVGATNDEIFGRSSDGSVWHNWLIASTGGWSDWGSMGGASGVTLTSDVAVGYNQFGAEELFARASDGSVWHDYLIAGTGGWSGWGSLGAPSGATLTSDIASSGTRSPTTADEVVSVLLTGSGAGSVSGLDINCPATCSMSDAQGSQIILSATPAAGSSFAGWSGPCSGAGTCTTTLDSAERITAAFSKNSSVSLVSVTTSTGAVTTAGTVTTSTGAVTTAGIVTTSTGTVTSPGKPTLTTTTTTTTSGAGAATHRSKCVVPRLPGFNLPGVRRALARAHCSLGTVHRPRRVQRHHTLRVVSQSPRPASSRPADYPVEITLR
ncbi:MAG: putative Ig domain-containing protein [Solirubrobacteraceae bacterium]